MKERMLNITSRTPIDCARAEIVTHECAEETACAIEIENEDDNAGIVLLVEPDPTETLQRDRRMVRIELSTAEFRRLCSAVEDHGND
jgi:hypothetical protein